MTNVLGTGMTITPLGNSGSAAVPTRENPELEEIGIRFEQLLWADMLSHTGLEEAFTQSGGEGASAFSRMIIESIAEDLARSHPLGLNAAGMSEESNPMLDADGLSND